MLQDRFKAISSRLFILLVRRMTKIVVILLGGFFFATPKGERSIAIGISVFLSDSRSHKLLNTSNRGTKLFADFAVATQSAAMATPA